MLDVSQVEDADVSGGFGSLHFTTTAARSTGDVRIATLEAKIGFTANGNALTPFDGYFYVCGD